MNPAVLRNSYGLHKTGGLIALKLNGSISVWWNCKRGCPSGETVFDCTAWTLARALEKQHKMCCLLSNCRLKTCDEGSTPLETSKSSISSGIILSQLVSFSICLLKLLKFEQNFSLKKECKPCKVLSKVCWYLSSPFFDVLQDPDTSHPDEGELKNIRSLVVWWPAITQHIISELLWTKEKKKKRIGKRCKRQRKRYDVFQREIPTS